MNFNKNNNKKIPVITTATTTKLQVKDITFDLLRYGLSFKTVFIDTLVYRVVFMNDELFC